MRSRPGRPALGLMAIVGMVVGAGCAAPTRLPAARDARERRGRHLLLLAARCSCHGTNFAGWRQGGHDLLPEAAPYGERFVGPFGVIPAPNITPDPETGIGGWSDAAITRALRDGIRPDGQRLYPLMPYEAYHGMVESDSAALIAYLRRLRRVRNAVPPRRLAAPVPDTGPLPPAPERPPDDGISVGRYLVNNVSACGDCHTPAGPEPGRLLAGKLLPLAPGRAVVAPNITPDRETGIGRWSEKEIAHYLRTGSRPDGGLAHSLMAGVILFSSSHLTTREANAVAAYLKTIPPVRRRPDLRRE